MNIIETLLDSLQTDAPVRQVLVGLHWTMVTLDTDPPLCGLASTIQSGVCCGESTMPNAGHLQEQTGRALAELLRSPNPLEASIGMATFNALLPVKESVCSEVNAEALILEHGTGRSVAVVGHFPFVERVRQVAATCWVVEQSPRPGDLPADQAAAVLPQADVIALTGTSLINHTFEDLIRLCRPDAFVLLLGPSTPLSPVLFEAGVTAISGTRVIDPQRVLHSVAQGATFRQLKRVGGVRLLTWVRKVGTCPI